MNIGASGGGTRKYWCAFGVAQQQWGKILGDTVNLKIINFPVSFNECFGGLALFNGDPVAAAEYATITDITNTNFKIYMYANNAGTGYANANIFYLFLGAQPQWGKPTVRGNNIFPIPFPNSALAITSAGIGGWHTVDVSIVNNNSYSVLGWATDSPSTARTSLPNVIAIGF